MRARDFCNELKELKQCHVHVKNPSKVNQTLTILLEGGFKKMHTISDFDRTITMYKKDGEILLTSFGVFSKIESLGPQFEKENMDLLNKYYPIEIDPKMSFEEKAKHMNEWWTKTISNIKGKKVTSEEIYEACKKYSAPLRNGVTDYLQRIHEENSTVIMSAGLGDVVIPMLRQNNALFPSITIISNFLKFNSEGAIVGYHHRPMHTYNKSICVLENSEYYNKFKEKPNAILIGDTLGDADMTNCLENSTVLKIGFLNEKINESLEIFKNTFDIVVVDDSTFHVPLAVLSCFGK